MRPSHDEWGLRGAEWVASRATCLRRSVGCVLTNARHQVIGTGYNGRAAGMRHCDERMVGDKVTASDSVTYPFACLNVRALSGTMLDSCEAIHAEQNALLQCGDVYSIRNCYVTHSPCITCVKLLMNTGCVRIMFRERYAHDDQARVLWTSMAAEYRGDMGDRIRMREWVCLPRPS